MALIVLYFYLHSSTALIVPYFHNILQWNWLFRTFTNILQLHCLFRTLLSFFNGIDCSVLLLTFFNCINCSVLLQTFFYCIFWEFYHYLFIKTFWCVNENHQINQFQILWIYISESKPISISAYGWKGTRNKTKV